MSRDAPLQLKFGDLVVDLERKAAKRGNAVVNLTHTEFARRARHHGKPVSRKRRLDVVWNAAQAPKGHAVDTCLWRLRRKFGDSDGESRWIRNLPGIGYVLECEIRFPEDANPIALSSQSAK